VVITDTLPPSVTSNAPLVWNIGTVNASIGGQIVFTATLQTNTLTGTTLINTAFITTTSNERERTNNVALFKTRVVQVIVPVNSTGVTSINVRCSTAPTPPCMAQYTYTGANDGSVELDGNSNFSYTGLERPAPMRNSDFNFRGVAFEVGLLSNGQIVNNYTVTTPITITMPYQDSDVPPPGLQALKIGYWSGVVWQDAATLCNPTGTYSYDTSNKTVTVTTCQLGIFGLIAQEYKVYLPLVVR
jgi:hypothetical protein